MDFPINIVTIKMEWSVIYFEGSHTILSRYCYMSVPEDHFRFCKL